MYKPLQTATLIRAIRKRATDDEWKLIDAARLAYERPIISEMEAIFDEQLEEVLEKLDGLRHANYETRADFFSVDFIFDLAGWIQKTAGRLSRFIWNAISGGYDAGEAQMLADLPDLTSNDPLVKSTLENLIGKSQNITHTTRDRLAGIVDDALREGWSIDRVAKEIKDDFSDMKAHRPKTIAQTSVTAGFSAGQDASFKRAGVEKIWLSQRDGRVRPTHHKADTQTVGPNDKFIVGRAELRFPGDPETNHLEEVINCRCAMLPGRRVNQ